MATARAFETALANLKRAIANKAVPGTARYVPGIAERAADAADGYARKLSSQDATDINARVVVPLRSIVDSSRRLTTGNASPDDSWESITATLREVEKYPITRARMVAADVGRLRGLSKHGIPSLPADVEKTIGSYLTGKTGSLAVQQSQAQADAGLPGVKGKGRRKTRKGKGRGKTKRTRKH